MRLRLTLAFVAVVIFTVAGILVIARLGTASEIQNFMFRGGASGVDELVTSLESYYASQGSWQGAEALLIARGAGPGHGAGMRGQGNAAGQGGMGANQRLVLTDASGQILYDTAGVPVNSGSRLSAPQLQGAIELHEDGQPVGYLYPEGSQAFTNIQQNQLLDRLNRAAVTAGLVSGGLALVLALFLAAQLIRPVRALTQAAERVALGDLTQRVEVQGRDELARLGQTFNHMAGSLYQAQEGRRAMTADIAHELRNPLAVQRANLEALQDGIYPLNPENLQPILEQNLLLTRIVQDLRTLALVESGQMALERTEIDFSGLVQRLVDRFQPQAARRSISIHFRGCPDCPSIQADPGRLEQIVGNLLSNALRYTTETGIVELAIGRDRGDVILTVRDHGPGISPEALPRVFERFYRADKSRSREEGGTGLGLAIARRLAEAHNGTLTAENHAMGGALFTLRLPLGEIG
jgi:two-component system, OmpR family, sensor histidine kinase BaeS